MKELNAYLMEVVSKCSKCKDCVFRFNPCYCYLAYECIRNDFSHFRQRKNLT